MNFIAACAGINLKVVNIISEQQKFSQVFMRHLQLGLAVFKLDSVLRK